MEQTINHILNNVKYVPKCGNPGSLIVFDSNAFPILAGNDANSVIFAAAQFGKGRVFVTSHEIYIDNFIKFNNEFGNLWYNIKTWLNHGELFDDKEIKDIADYDSVNDILKSDVKILKWTGTCHKNEMFITNLLKRFVHNGGAIICGICPWGWLNTSNGKTLEDMSLNKFLFELGISLSSKIAVMNNYIKTKQNQARFSHFQDNVKLLDSDMNQGVKLESYFVNAISSIPNEKAFNYLESLHKVLYKYVISNYRPSFENHVSCPTGRAILTIASRLYQKYSICGIKCRAPNIEEFPACNLLHPETVSEVISIKSKYDEFHFSGFYLPPGGCCTITILEGNPSGWHVFIGSHTDDLTNMNSLKRWPIITTSLKLKKTLSLTSAFGGLIYFESPKGNSTLKIKLDSVVEAPYYDLNKPETIRKWHENSQSSSPWAELCGKHVSFCVPSSSIRSLKDPSEALKIWDQIVKSNHDLRGTNVEGTWRERIVVDIQPSGGFIHAGYPIVIFYSYANVLFDKNKILTHCWSIIHEFGHNMQRSIWVPEESCEAMANLFAYHSIETVFRQKTWPKVMAEKYDEKLLEKFASNGFKRDDWLKNSSLPLLLYVQLVKSFGWNSFRILFREYEAISNNKEMFKSDVDKWDQFILRFSNIVGLNVTPLFIFWGINFSDKIDSSLSDLTPWLPNDDITQLFPERVKYCRKNYNFMLFGNESMYSNFQI